MALADPRLSAGQAGGMGVDCALLALPEREGRAGLPADLLLSLDAGRPGASGTRAEDGGPAGGVGVRRLVLRGDRGRARGERHEQAARPPAGVDFMARPERFELPTPWFVGRFKVVWYPVNQPLAALAAYLSSMFQSQSRHTQFGLVTLAARRPASTRVSRAGAQATDRSVSQPRPEALPANLSF